MSYDRKALDWLRVMRDDTFKNSYEGDEDAARDVTALDAAITALELAALQPAAAAQGDANWNPAKDRMLANQELAGRSAVQYAAPSFAQGTEALDARTIEACAKQCEALAEVWRSNPGAANACYAIASSLRALSPPQIDGDGK